MKNMKYEPTKFMLPTSHYSEKRADRVVNFIESLSHTKGRWYGEKFKLMDWQEKIVRDVFGVIKENGYRQFNTAYVEISKKNGKQLALDTLIPTPSGYKTMGDLRVGDKVISDLGEKCNVVCKSEVDDKEKAYKITFECGEEIVAGMRHEWYISFINRNIPKVIFNTEEMYNYIKCGNTLAIRRDSDFSYFVIKRIEPINEKVKMQCIQVDSINHCYLVGKSGIPTHNSELAAAVALYLLSADGEQRAEIYGAAADRQQASIVFDVAADMVRLCPDLNKRCKILTANKRILYIPTNSFYQVLSADVSNKHGFNVHGVVFDELHTQPNRKLYDVLTKGSGDARLQPLFFLITTAGDNLNSICYEVHQKAKDVLTGKKIDPTFYPVIYGAEMDEDWSSEDVWKKANPSLGKTLTIDKIRDAYNQAKDNPAEENVFRQLRLNQWVKQTVRWMPMDFWDKCDFSYNVDDLLGRDCFGGLDLSSTTDITAFVLVFPPLHENDRYIVYPHFWIPNDTIDIRVRKDHVPYDVWVREGLINVTEGNVVHYSFIEKYIDDLGKKFHIKEIAFDRWGATQMVQNLEEMGFMVVPFGQGFKDMTMPCKELYKLVLEKKISHAGNKVLRWMVDNIAAKTDAAGNVKFDKEKSSEKIDGAVALVMALDVSLRNKKEEESVYNERGLITF